MLPRFGHRPPWPAGDRGSRELQRSGDSGHQKLRARLERGGRGDSILGLPDGAAAEKGEGRGRPWVAAGELVGSSAQARIGKSSAWRR